MSTRSQAHTGLGLDAQKAAIESWAARMGVEIGEWATDAGVSGRYKDRPGLDAALDRLTVPRSTPRGVGPTPGAPSSPSPARRPTLVVAKLDRLTRSVVHLGQLVERLARAGVELVVIQEGVDTTTPAGRLAANILVSVAQWEAEIIGERTRAAKAQARERGAYLGGAQPVPVAHVELARSIPGSLAVKAREMAARGVVTSRGTPYARQAVGRMLRGAA